MIVNRSAPPGAVVPVLIYEDVARAIEWLCEAFGFVERLRTLPEADGNVHHAQLAVGKGAVILTDGRKRAPAGSLLQNLYVQIEDAAAHVERARRFGARILREPQDCEFGERQYSAEDLAGNCWTFSQSIADVAPETWGAQVGKLAAREEIPARPRFCYLETPAADAHRSAEFYEKVFGWNIRHRETPRPSFDDAAGYISGAWVTGRKAWSEPGLLPYIWVDSLKATLALVRREGGEIVKEPHPDHPGGNEAIAWFRDPAGNLMGLYQED